MIIIIIIIGKKKSNTSLSYVYFYSLFQTRFYCITAELHLLDSSIVVMNLGFIKVVWGEGKIIRIDGELNENCLLPFIPLNPTSVSMPITNQTWWCLIEDFIFSSTNISKPSSLFWRLKVITVEALNPGVYIFSLSNYFFFLFNPFLEKK